jgi:hypothetical protein
MYGKERFFPNHRKCGFVCTGRGGCVNSNPLCVRDRDESPPYAIPIQPPAHHTAKPRQINGLATQSALCQIGSDYLKLGFVMQSRSVQKICHTRRADAATTQTNCGVVYPIWLCAAKSMPKILRMRLCDVRRRLAGSMRIRPAECDRIAGNGEDNAKSQPKIRN